MIDVGSGRADGLEGSCHETETVLDEVKRG